MSCSEYANPDLTAITTTYLKGENRLVVIILRGGMDGLAVVPPVGDPGLATWRGKTRMDRRTSPVDLDGFFTLHHALAPLMGLWNKKQLAFAHAVSTPYRDRRSHFDGQDLLEAGVPDFGSGRTRDGWLNRMVQHMPDARPETAFAIGAVPLLVLSGEAEVSQWTPAAGLVLSQKTLGLAQNLMNTHPLFAKAMSGILSMTVDSTAQSPLDAKQPEALEAAVRAALQEQVTGGRSGEMIARFTAERLRGDTRVAAFAINDWDTHANQAKTLHPPLQELCSAILTLESELGEVWNKTTVVAMTEFGRTVQLNGTNGTDHGTAGVMLFAGGALNGGRVLTDWPGLDEADLYDRRDLRSTRDVRDYSAWLLRDLFGIEQSVLETTIFPGLIMQDNPALLL